MQHISLKPFLPGYNTRMTVLPNGLTVVTENIPNARSVGMTVKMYSGAALAAAGKHGAPHILEHILAGQDVDQDGVSLLDRFCEQHGYSRPNASNSAYINTYGLGARGQPQRVRPEHAVWYMERLLTELMDPGFIQSQFEKEKTAIREELYTRIRAANYSTKILWDRIFKTASGIKQFWLGRQELTDLAELDGIKLDDVIAHHANHYGPNRAYVFMAGAVNHDEVVASIAKHTEKWNPVAPLVRHELQYQPTEYRCHSMTQGVASKQVDIELLFPMLAHSVHDNADLEQVNHHMLARTILAKAIQQQLRAKEGLVYSAGIAGGNEDIRPIAVALSASCDVEKIPAVAEGFAQAIEYSLKNADRLIEEAKRSNNVLYDLLEPATIGRVEELAATTLRFGNPIPLEETRKAVESFNAAKYGEIIRAVYGQQLSLRVIADWRHMYKVPDTAFFQDRIARVVPRLDTDRPVEHVDNLTAARRRIVQAYSGPARMIRVGRNRFAAYRAS